MSRPWSEDAFVCAVHDLRNLSWAVAMGVCELDPDLPNADLQARIAELSDIARTLTQVARGVIDTRHGVQAERPRTLHLGTFVERVWADAAPYLRTYRLEDRVDIRQPEQEICVDDLLLERALLNLLWNAAKHARGATAVWLTARADEDQVYFRVEDDGCGLGRARNREAQRFVDGQERCDVGWGLGLLLVREATEALGGHLTVGQSKYGGASFMLSVPLMPPPSDA